MLVNKRTFKRFDLPLIVKFRPTYGGTPYYLGLTKNLSWQGLGLESRNFNFILSENLELELKLPQSATSVSLLGDVVWNRQSGKTSFAGIKFKLNDETKHYETMDKISSYTNIAFDNIMQGKGIHKKLKEKIKEKLSFRKAVLKSKPSEKDSELGLKKQYHKNGFECKVTFIFPKKAAQDARSITIVGDFNNWNTSESPMKRLKNGDFQTSLNLFCGREYRFRYLIDSNRWENDWHADKYMPNSFGSDDSVVVV